MKSFFHFFSVKMLEALKTWAMCHHQNIFHDLFLILSNKFQAKEKLHFEVFEQIRLETFHQINIILG